METTRNNSFPAIGDKLFVLEQNGTQWFPMGAEDFFQLSEGYRMAAVTIYKEIKEREWVNKPFIACAMIFCLRQFLEIRLKELVYMARKELFKTPDFQKEHNLSKLFDDYTINVLPRIDPAFEQSMVDVVKGLIDEFNSIDPMSMAFRYPVDKKNRPTLKIPNTDLENFKDVMDKLSNYFDAQLELVKMLENFNDEMAAEKAAEYASYMCQNMY